MTDATHEEELHAELLVGADTYRLMSGFATESKALGKHVDGPAFRSALHADARMLVWTSQGWDPLRRAAGHDC
jgi:hypothetical protein